jgi:hypothetical protein
MDDEMMAEIEAVIAANDPEELLGVIIELALSAEDAEWAEDCCVRLAQHPDTNVRGNAVVGFAHLAERFGDLDREKVEPIITAALGDPKEYVRQHAEVAKVVLS